MTVPAFRWLWSVRDAKARHLRRYSRIQLFRLFRESGFTVDLLTYYQFFLMPVAFLVRILGKLNESFVEREEHPGRIINAVFSLVNTIEVKLGRWINFPWGLSLVAVCTKN